MNSLGIPSRYIYHDESESEVIYLGELPDVLAFYLERMADRFRGEELHEILLAEADALRAAVI